MSSKEDRYSHLGNDSGETEQATLTGEDSLEGIRVAISDGNDEVTVMVDSDREIDADDILEAIEKAGRDRPKTLAGSWMRLATSMSRLNWVAVAGAGAITVTAVKAVTGSREES